MSKVDKQELDGILERWAQATAPDSTTIQHLQSRVRSGLEHKSPCPLDGESGWFESPRWLWCLSRVACALLLTALGCWFIAGKALDSASVSIRTECRNTFCCTQHKTSVGEKCFPWELSKAPSQISLGVVASKELDSLDGAISDLNKTPGLNLAQQLRGQLIFQQVCQMPGLVGPYRPDAFLLVAIPKNELEWMAMTHIIWRAVIQAN